MNNITRPNKNKPTPMNCKGALWRARTRSEHAEASDKSCPGDASRLPQLSECGEKVLG